MVGVGCRMVCVNCVMVCIDCGMVCGLWNGVCMDCNVVEGETSDDKMVANGMVERCA